MSSVKEYYKNLAERLITIYAKQCLSKAINSTKSNKLERCYNKLHQNDKNFIKQILKLSDILNRYTNPADLDKVFETIDLPKIYQGVDNRELTNKDPNLKYEDIIVLELLGYFKNGFFKWITQPDCPQCGHGQDNMALIGILPPPLVNPDEISRIESYRCKSCNTNVDFPRYNNAIKLLETRMGRCGEWVNCFLLILKALLGSNAKIRYIWNAEDHVWCEYYSIGLKRWIHLDPCEGVFDKPSLYCQNWGKKMSVVIGFGDDYIIDLSDKYITSEDKKIKSSNSRQIELFVNLINYQKTTNYYFSRLNSLDLSESEKLLKLYNDVLLLYNQEKSSLKLTQQESSSEDRNSATGRQSGGKGWTKARGEAG